MILLLKLCFNTMVCVISVMRRASRGVWWETNSHFTSNSLKALQQYPFAAEHNLSNTRRQVSPRPVHTSHRPV